MKLQGKIALVTGSSRSIGRAIALGLAREGADVAVHHSGGRPNEAAEVAGAIRDMGRRSMVVAADVKDEAEIDRMFGEVVAEMGGLDVQVNNAGIMILRPFLELSAADWDAVMNTNARGYFLCTLKAARIMVQQGRGGRIINVGSVRHDQVTWGSTHYCASKGAINSLTRGAALELARHGIRVNNIAPGTIETDLNRKNLADPEFRRRRLDMIPTGRLGDSEDCVGLAILLASDESDYITGATLVVDGGQGLM